MFNLGYKSTTHLPQAIIVFLAEEHRNAMTQMDDLIATVPFPSTCYVVQARAHQPTTRPGSRLTSPKGLYVSYPGEYARGM